MIKRYEYIDNVVKANSKYIYLKAGEDLAIRNIFRIISGTVDIKDIFNNKKYKLRDNFLKFPTETNDKLNYSKLSNNFPPEINLSDLNNYFNKAKQNKKFYKSIEVELVKCLVAYKENKILESFFYLYRLIEGISYSVPLIYISKKTDYNKTYKQLKSFFTSDKDGELVFFKTFVSETFKDEDFFRSSINIDLKTIEIEEIRTKYYKMYLDKIDNKHIITSEENESIEIKFIGLYDVLIEFRNRFFHNLKGSWHSNFESNELLYPDIFFKPIILHGINWISIILFEIIKVDFEKIDE